MEKYTVDIDKVLDDFEESEALEKVLGSQEGIFVEPWEHLTNNEVRTISGSKVDSPDLKLIQICHEISPKQANVIEPPESSSQKQESNELDLQNNYNEKKNLYDYEIFYKPFQSMSLTSHQSTNESKTCSGSSNHSEFNGCNIHQFPSDGTQRDTNEDILCVSVQKKDYIVDDFIEQTNKHICLVNPVLHNDCDQKSTESESSVKLSKNCDRRKVVEKFQNSDLSKNSLNFSTDATKIYSKEKISESYDQFSSKIDIDELRRLDEKASHSQIDASLIHTDSSLKSISDEKKKFPKENKVKCFDIPPTSCLYDKISGHTKIFSLDSPHNSEFSFSCLDIGQCHEEIPPKICDQSLPVKICTEGKHCSKNLSNAVNHLVNDTTTVSFFDIDSKNITMEEMDEYLENLSDVDVIQEDVSSQDSGVSSQKDINGNAFTSEGKKADNSETPIENKSRDGKNMIVSNLGHLNYDLSDTCRNKSKEGKTMGSKQLIYSESEVDNDLFEDNLIIVPGSHLITEINNKDANEMQSIEKNDLSIKNYNISGDISEKILRTFIDDAGEEILPVVDRKCESQRISRCLDHQKAEMDVPKSSKSNECDDTIESQSPTCLKSCNEVDMKLSGVTFERDDSNIYVESVCEYNSSSTEFISTLNSDETTVSGITTSFEKSMCLPHRLQRPTTLDLPSRRIANAEASDALIPSANSLDKSQNEEFSSLSESPPEEPKLSDSGEFNRQIPQIGVVKPFWIPDADAANCMHCNIKFTVIKRRHHCRACGKVLCSRCCNQKARLLYLQNKEDRICQPCAEILLSATQDEKTQVLPGDTQSSSSCGSSPNFSPTPQINPNCNLTDKSWRPHPNNPDDYCSTVPPLQQIQLSEPRPPPTVMVPIGVLKRGNKPRKEPKQVIFSDGIRPGGDLTSLTETIDAVPAYRRLGRKRVDKMSIGDAMQSQSGAVSSAVKNNVVPKAKQRRIVVSDAEGPLPPILLPLDNFVEKMDLDHLLLRLTDGEQRSVVFAVTKNMHVISQMAKLDCCFGKECLCFTSQGLCTVGQDEVMVILERLPEEKVIPRDIFKLFTKIYDNASKGTTFEELSHIIFPEGIFGSCEQTGFLFVRPTFQCLNKLPVPITPFLVAILIQKWEVPWANVFPLRLMLRLGAECRYYPCALVSVRGRKPVYFEIGQTIMNVLADLRNYQFTIPTVPGLVVHMEEKKTSVNIPRNRYDKVMKVLSSNYVEHVLALGSNFSTEADSHLVCMQKDDGDYHTQAINIQNTTRRVTGASFIVFSGALKTSSGLSAKFSIVEDGLLVQIPQETMAALNMSLRDMKDLTIPCGQINSTDPDEVVVLQWTRDDKKFNLGVWSPIDGNSLEGVPNVRIHTSTDYAGEHYLIRWTEVFFLEVEKSGNSRQNEMVDPCRLAETVAQSFCMALTPYLDMLADADLKTIGLRVSIDSERDKVEYDVGACGKPLPGLYMNALDSGLIPVILRLSGSSQSEPLALELIFHILFK